MPLARFPACSLWAVLAVLAFAGCETLQLGHPLNVSPDDVITDGGSISRTNVTDQAPAPPLMQLWEQSTEGGFGFASPLVADGLVIASTRAGRIEVFELRSGDRVGRVALGEAIEGAPVLIDHEHLVVPLASGKDGLIAYSLDSGATLWSLDGGPQAAGPLFVGELLVAGAVDGTVRGIDARSGQVRWAVRPDSMASYIAAPTSLGENLVLVADDSGGLLALNPQTGETAWSRRAGASVVRAPAAFGNLVYVPTSGGILLALDTCTGETIWKHSTDSPYGRFTTPAVDGLRLVVGASDGILRSLDPQTGGEHWSHRFDGNVAGAPLLSGDVVFAGTMDERVVALDAATGELLWELKLPGRVKSAMAARDGVLVVLSEPKHVHAFRTQTLASNDSGN